MSRKLITTNYRLRIRYHKSIEGIHTNILYVDILYQGMQYLFLCIAYIALQFRQ